MAIQRINYGAAPDDGTGDPLRVAFKKSDDNFADLDNRKAEQQDVADALAGKVDAVAGKGLSTNDYTTAEKNKLAGVQDNATYNRPDSETDDALALKADTTSVATALASNATADRNRANHTGTQPAATISDFSAASLVEMQVFGLGITGTAPLLADLDARDTPSGVYRLPSTSTGTRPTDAGANCFVEVIRFNNVASRQILHGTNTTTPSARGMWFRNMEGASATTEWIRVLTEAWPGPLNYSWAVRGGTANAITLTPAFTRTAYATGDEFRFRATATNTGATTINVNGLGAKTAVTVTGAALPTGYIRTGVDTVCVYDGTNFVVDREIERGSNANGEYTKFADGTCMAWRFFAGDVATSPGAQVGPYTVPTTFTSSTTTVMGFATNAAGASGVATLQPYYAEGWSGIAGGDVSRVAALRFSSVGRWY